MLYKDGVRLRRWSIFHSRGASSRVGLVRWATHQTGLWLGKTESQQVWARPGLEKYAFAEL